ncbi:fluoride efflux transporter CrcB [Geminocystis herdmanii]|uniref:fluoride efflux transporter CrcB n=1 Tax=Geminocystis herdmanii TaxID=669359 RepID=UPI0003479A3C|nr:fluoride efflux transporter CrcB [Geminocystis herdmanii]
MNDSVLKIPLLISLGAIFGALSRYYLTVYFADYSKHFPLGTFVINISGCFFIGIFAFLAQESIVSSPFQLLFVTGFLGSYTTFSTYILESSKLWKNNQKKYSLLYGIGSIITGIFVLEIGINLTKIILTKG